MKRRNGLGSLVEYLVQPVLIKAPCAPLPRDHAFWSRRGSLPVRVVSANFRFFLQDRSGRPQLLPSSTTTMRYCSHNVTQFKRSYRDTG